MARPQLDAAITGGSMSRPDHYRPADDRAWADMAAHLTEPQPRWICPYCWNEVRDEQTACCGETHAVPMPDDWEDDDAA